MKGIIRPEAVILGHEALVPDKNRISPAPNQFTHELTRPQDYSFTGGPDKAPCGRLAAGTKVVLLVHDGGCTCRVADGRGLYVEVEFAALKKL